LDFTKYSLVPYLRNWESELNRKLLSTKEMSTHFFKFQTKELLRGDADSRADYYRKLFEIGVLSPNEIRTFEDLNKIKDGDEHFVPLNLSPIDSINKNEDEKK
jgi:HK97 family phage portal protein